MKKISVLSLLFLLLNCFFTIAQNLNNPGFDSLMIELNKITKEDTNKVNLLCKISDVCPEEDMLKYVKPALRLAQKLNYKRGIADALSNISYAAVLKGDNSEALQNYKIILKIEEEIGDKKLMATTLNNIGYIYQHFGDISVAVDYYMRGLKIQEEIGEKKQIAISLVNLGDIYDSQGEKQKAYECYQKAFEINELLNDPEGVCLSLNNLGIYYDDHGDRTRALWHYKKSLAIAEQYGLKSYIALSFSSIASLYKDQEEWENALSFYMKSLKIREEIQQKSGLPITLSRISTIYMRQNRLFEAEKYGLKALVIAKELGDPDLISDASSTLSLIFKSERKFEQAYSMHVLFKQMDDSIKNDRTKKEAIKNIFQYDFNKKETAIKAEQEKNEISHKSEVQKQKLITYSTAGIGGVVILSSIFTFFFYKRKRDADQKQKETSLSLQVSETEMKALRSQMNPHFIFNALQSIQTFLLSHKSEEANLYLLKFSKLMRAVLENSQHSEVSLKEDLLALELYMQLESIRLTHPFTYQFHIDESVDTESDSIPPLILQPFVENAIWHGLQYKKEPGKIDIYISKKDNALYATVEDNGVGRDMSKQVAQPILLKKESIGLKLTEQRLKLFSEIKKIKAEFRIIDLFTNENKPAGTKVELSLPLVA
jgi:tetratricopeptide (TPR) repeat protein